MTKDNKVLQNGEVIGSELAYVRTQIGRLDAAARKAAAAEIGCHVKTLNRLESKKTKYGRTDTIGKIAMYFRTRDRRRK